MDEFIKFKKDLDQLVDNCFSGNFIFFESKNKAFTMLMNRDFYSTKLAEFTDIQLRFGFRSLSESEIEKNLEDIINIFRCLTNKLKFQLDFTVRIK
jgi:hypothetical protein